MGRHVQGGRGPLRQTLMPRGGGDVVRQLAIWLVFAVAYETARGLARGTAAEALRNVRELISIEQSLGAFVEPSVQRHVIDASQTLVTAANWTYWIAEFGVVTAALSWIYVRHTDRYFVVRNAVIATNLIGFVGYVLVPAAPPRLVPGHGFVDTLADSSSLHLSTPVVAFAANKYAAMPSLHVADALVVGVALATLARRRWVRAFWLAWPVWVTASLIVTANHFWLDAVAGAIVAVLGGAIAVWIASRSAVAPDGA